MVGGRRYNPVEMYARHYFPVLLLPQLLLTPSNDQPTTTAPATQPAVSDAVRGEVERLIKQLGSRRFKDRESAQTKLAEMGDDAAALLVPHITSRDPEVAARVAAVLGTPSNPRVRVELALRLITSTDANWMERGVHMLFQSPRETAELFMERTGSARGRDRVIFEPIREQFEAWQRMERMFQEHYGRVKDKNPERAEALRKSHEESALYCAEAAYWGAQDALADAQTHPPPDSTASEPPTTAPSE